MGNRKGKRKRKRKEDGWEMGWEMGNGKEKGGKGKGRSEVRVEKDQAASYNIRDITARGPSLKGAESGLVGMYNG